MCMEPDLRVLDGKTASLMDPRCLGLNGNGKRRERTLVDSTAWPMVSLRYKPRGSCRSDEVPRFMTNKLMRAHKDAY